MDSAREQARQDNGQFGTQPLAESQATLASTPEILPMGVILRRQQWINDHAVDIDNGEHFDLAPVLSAMSAQDREETVQALAADGNAYSDWGDNLVHGAETAGLIEEHSGPFSLDVDTDELTAWHEAHPVTPELIHAAQQAMVKGAAKKVAVELEQIRAAEARLTERSNRLELASRILSAGEDVKPGDTIDIMRWNDEPNEDGSHDIGFAMMRNADGEKVGNFGENTGIEDPISAGWDGATDFDIFMGHADGREFIEVDKVHEWIARGAR